MRSYYGMDSRQKGVLVRHVQPTAPAVKVLQADDILMSFDGVQIANDGTVPFRCPPAPAPCCHAPSRACLPSA